MDEPGRWHAGPGEDLTVRQGLAMADAIRCVLAHLRRESTWFTSDSSPEHIMAMAGVLGRIAAESLAASWEAEGLDGAAARARAVEEMDQFLAQVEVGLLDAGLPMAADDVGGPAPGGP